MWVCSHIHSHFEFDFRLCLGNHTFHAYETLCGWQARQGKASKRTIIPQLFDNRTLMRTAHGKCCLLLNQIKTKQNRANETKNYKSSTMQWRQMKMEPNKTKQKHARLYNVQSTHTCIQSAVNYGWNECIWDFQELEMKRGREREIETITSSYIYMTNFNCV